MTKKALFIDRDGVINKSIIRNGKPYAPINFLEFEMLDGVEEAFYLLKKSEYMSIIVTNQPDIASGKQTLLSLNKLHNYLQEKYSIDLIRVCPHKEEDGCDCRKPKPGMIISASKKLNININFSYMIGDRWTDILCGQRAGCKENFYIDNNYSEKKPDKPFTHVPSLLHCVRKILAINDDVDQTLKC